MPSADTTGVFPSSGAAVRGGSRSCGWALLSGTAGRLRGSAVGLGRQHVLTGGVNIGLGVAAAFAGPATGPTSHR